MEQDAHLAVPVIGRDHTQGPEDAPITLVEYGDYECPYSRRAVSTVHQLQERLGDRLRFVYRNFPLTDVHPHALAAAEMAEAAAAQGAFWQMYGHLFAHQRALEERDLLHYAEVLGLDVDRARAELASHVYLAQIQEDVASGRQSGVSGTPTFFINGVRHDGPFTFEGLVAAIERLPLGEVRT